MENNQLVDIIKHVDIPTILIVDDDPDIIEFLNKSIKIFKEYRYKLVFATTGEGATSIINIQDIDAIVLDIKLPDVTGISIGQRIKEHDPDIPVVIFTSYSGDNVKEQVREIGATYWYKLEKMADPESLLNSLYNLVMKLPEEKESKNRIMSQRELENMKERRKARIERLAFPSFLIENRIKFSK